MARGESSTSARFRLHVAFSLGGVSLFLHLAREKVVERRADDRNRAELADLVPRGCHRRRAPVVSTARRSQCTALCTKTSSGEAEFSIKLETSPRCYGDGAGPCQRRNIHREALCSTTSRTISSKDKPKSRRLPAGAARKAKVNAVETAGGCMARSETVVK